MRNPLHPTTAKPQRTAGGSGLQPRLAEPRRSTEIAAASRSHKGEAERRSGFATPTATFFRYLAAGALALSMAGCAMTREPLRFYTLDAPPVERPLASLPELSLGVGPIRMPTILDRPGIVTRIDAHRVEVLTFDQWAGNLKGEVQNLFADQLGRQLGTQRIALYPWSGDSVELQVTVDLLEMVGEPGGKATLTASWSLIDAHSHKVLRLEKSTRETDVAGNPPAEIPPKGGAGISELVAAYSRLAAQLAAEIAQEIVDQRKDGSAAAADRATQGP